METEPLQGFSVPEIIGSYIQSFKPMKPLGEELSELQLSLMEQETQAIFKILFAGAAASALIAAGLRYWANHQP